ncbi:DUF2865 domain-containing protein [Mesorhizobium composti]|uniref:DUF2865 domain-containing protein n=2 Tax=Ollibium composti TaxID=2675109 RepID=A0ABY2QCD6_9HYPH|nr:DUF2865 domain-containing protein [Mesorhizobium composti]
MKGDRRAQMLAAALMGAAVLVAFAPAAAQASAHICRQLEAELAGAPRGGSGPAQLNRYDAAIARQQSEIAKARSQARTLGCGFSLFSGNVSQCASLNAALSRMNGNLDKLERKRAQLSGGGKRRSRARLMALLDKNGCRDRKAEDKAVTIRSSDGSVQRLLGETIERADRPNEVSLPGGEYRTLCVRTCDGYFFPMSNAASAGDFERDQKNCESSCPGAAIQLFYTRGMDEDSSRMISVATGRPYGDLSTAYLYKKPNASVPQSCGCNAPRDFSILGGGSSGVSGAGPTSSPTMQSLSPSVSIMPAARPDPAADPETQANAEGGLDIETIRRLAAEKAAENSSGDRKVRVVGPRFLPDPSGAIDLRAPAPKKGP